MADKLKITLTNKDVVDLYKALKGVDNNTEMSTNKWFSYEIMKNLSDIKTVVEDLQRLNETIKPTERVQEFQMARQDLMLKYCSKTKDENGNEIPDTIDPMKTQYRFEKENYEKFRTEEKELSDKYKTDLEEWEKVINEFNEILEKNVEVEFTGLTFKHIPDNFKVTYPLEKLIRSEE